MTNTLFPAPGGMPRICVPLTGETLPALAAQCAQLGHIPFDLVEWRIDYLKDRSERQEALALLRKSLPDTPLLATFRTAPEGGEADITDSDYDTLLQGLIRSGEIAAVDMEYRFGASFCTALAQEAEAHGVYPIVSSHDFEKTPANEEMTERLEAMLAAGGAAKLAVMPQAPEDVLRLLAVTDKIRRTHPDRVIITMAMGKLGIISRLAGEIFGSALTFAAAGRASAPGQIDARLLREILLAIHGGK